jgi:hypothetical protein
MVVKKAKKAIKANPYHGQSFFIFVGLLMVVSTLTKLLGHLNFSSDWFWFVAGLGITVEGFLMLNKERKFNKKYKVVERKEC